MTVAGDPRLDELLAALGSVRTRIAAAARAAGRGADDVHLVAVSKGWPASDVLRLVAGGQVDFGESYDQEAAAKSGTLSDAGAGICWHFVGRLQRNKCRSIARYADVVHSVDRVEVADAIAAGAHEGGRRVRVLIQVSLDGAPGRGGVDSAEVIRLADHVAALPDLELGGVMGVAPLDEPAATAFQRLAEVAAGLRADHPGAVDISAGMSGDLEDAVTAGATHLRVGTALFGARVSRG